MRQWPKVAMGELFHLEKGKIGIKASTPGFFPLVTTGEEYLSHIEPHFSGDSICIPLISATGHGHASLKRLHHIEGEFAVGSILCACVNSAPDRVVARYTYYYLSAYKDSVLIPLMQGTANMSMKVSDIAGVRIPLPPLAEQQAIVSRLDTLADKARQVNEHLEAIERDADRLLAVSFRDAIADAPLQPMAEVAPLVRREVAIELEGIYPELGIRSFGKGTFHKPPLTGADVGTKRLFSIEPGDLLFSNVFAWEGAIAVAQPGDAGRFGSHRFITCCVDPDITSAEFLRYYFLTDAGLEKIGEASPGGAGRNRTLGLEKLMVIQVPIPSRAVQRRFDTLQAKVAALKARHATIRRANNALIPATLERVFN
ncbi:MAG: restriction endonuclease subunit S [Acidithiobacillus ferrivorans]